MAYRRRRRFKRRAIRRRRTYKRRSTLNKSGIHHYKLKFQYTFSASAAGDIQDWISVNNPTGVVKGVGTVQDWSAVSALFDLYKVNAVKFHFVPRSPNEVFAVIPYRCVYSVYDIDGQPPFTISDFIQYDSLKTYSLFKSWSHYHKVKTVLNTAGVSTRRVGSWIDIATPTDNATLSFYTNSLKPNETYGDVIITYYCAFKSRR